MPDAGEEFWEFSLAFYALPRVAEALLALQDRHGRDVNLILFALWLGLSGRGHLAAIGLATAQEAIREVRLDLIEPLRRLRRDLKPNPAADIQHLRERIKALELEAEKAAQQRLAALAGAAADGIAPADRLEAAAANLALYLGPALADSAEARVIARSAATKQSRSGSAPPTEIASLRSAMTAGFSHRR
jgi:uncharacterized protein (TIGR02444 family)